MGKTLAGRTIFITGGSRGIGLAIALKAARDGANIVIAAKTAEPHPKLPGTIHTAAKQIEEAGGKCLPCIVDVRDENQVKNAVKAAVDKFGGIDILVNNASAIFQTQTQQTDMKRYDLMNNIITRGTFLVSKECIPHLLKSDHAHIINISPPLNLNPICFDGKMAYTIAKYGMSMCVLGMSHEFKGQIGVNALWPRIIVQSAAIPLVYGSEMVQYSRKPDIMADAAYHILCSNPKHVTGNFFIDEDVIRNAGMTDLNQYAYQLENANKLKTAIYSGISKNVDENADGSQIEGLFNTMAMHLNEELVRQTNATFHFNMNSGDGAGIWHLDLKNGNGSCGKGNGGIKPDVILNMNSKDFFHLFSGKLKAPAAFMSGKFKINGEFQKAMLLEKLMITLKSKL